MWGVLSLCTLQRTCCAGWIKQIRRRNRRVRNVAPAWYKFICDIHIALQAIPIAYLQRSKSPMMHGLRATLLAATSPQMSRSRRSGCRKLPERFAMPLHRAPSGYHQPRRCNSFNKAEPDQSRRPPCSAAFTNVVTFVFTGAARPLAAARRTISPLR
jgi:hypothetical protein